MDVERYARTDDFLASAGAFLVASEAEHNLILGICEHLRDDPRLYGHDPYFAVARDGGTIVATALRTPPHNLLLSEMADERAVEPLWADVRRAFAALPGVLGPTAVVARFARAWEALTGARAHVAVKERI